MAAVSRTVAKLGFALESVASLWEESSLAFLGCGIIHTQVTLKIGDISFTVAALTPPWMYILTVPLLKKDLLHELPSVLYIGSKNWKY